MTHKRKTLRISFNCKMPEWWGNDEEFEYFRKIDELKMITKDGETFCFYSVKELTIHELDDGNPNPIKRRLR